MTKPIELDLSYVKIDNFKWNDLNHLKSEIRMGFGAIQSLIDNQEMHISELDKKFKKQLSEDEDLRSMDDSTGQTYYAQMYESEGVVIKELNFQHRYSACLSLFSFFEGKLGNICKEIEDNNNFEIKIKDLNSKDDISKYINYITKVFKMNFTKIESLITPIKQQKTVRNKIAHKSGIISSDEKKQIQITSGLSISKYNSAYKIEIAKVSYFEKLISEMNIFFDELLAGVDVRNSEIQKDLWREPTHEDKLYQRKKYEERNRKFPPDVDPMISEDTPF